MRRCTHRTLIIRTERDRCSWVQCSRCKIRGPHKHSVVLAMLAWLVKIADPPRPRDR